MPDVKKARQTVTEFLGFTDGYQAWAVWAMLACLFTVVALLIFGRKSLDPASPAFTLAWDKTDLNLADLPDATGPYRLLLDEVTSALTSPPTTPPTEIRVLRAVTAASPRDASSVAVRLRSVPLSTGGAPFYPRFVAFAVRHSEGYTQVASLDPKSGKPPLGQAAERGWTLGKYRAKEYLEVVAFVVSQNPAEMTAIRNTPAAGLFEVTITPTK